MGNNLNLQERIRTALNAELTRRLLNRYFVMKGYTESFDKRIYPPILQDMAMLVPQLFGKIEIVPSVEDIDPNTGVVKLNWNLFALGNNRMWLGQSAHTNLSEVRTPIAGPLMSTARMTHATPKRIIEYLVKVLGNSKSGDLTIVPNTIMNRSISATPFSSGDSSGFFRTKHRPVY